MILLIFAKAAEIHGSSERADLRGSKPRSAVVLGVRAEALTYLRSNGHGNVNSKSKRECHRKCKCKCRCK
jgi:hypothetical protein